MSIESWKAEFYPVPAEQIVDESPLVHAEHAYLKWSGVTPANLLKHGLTKAKCSISICEGDNCFKFSTQECVWCHNYYSVPSGGCTRCPLYPYGRCGEPTAPFMKWFSDSDPQPMIDAILEILNELRRPTNQRTYSDSV